MTLDRIYGIINTVVQSYTNSILYTTKKGESTMNAIMNTAINTNHSFHNIHSTKINSNSNYNPNFPNTQISHKIVDLRQYISDHSNYPTNAKSSLKTPNTAVKQNVTPDTIVKQKKPAANGTVNAIQSKEDIQRLKDYFLYKTNNSNNQPKRERNYALVTFGFNTALRASDILNLKISDIFDENNNYRQNIIIREQKTGKKKDLFLNDTLKEALNLYLSTRDNITPDEYLFASSNKKNNYKLDVRSFSRLMKEAGREIGLSERLGSHTCRKTFARQVLSNNPNNPNIIISVSQALNHSSPSVTYRYADITKTEMQMLYESNQI